MDFFCDFSIDEFEIDIAFLNSDLGIQVKFKYFLFLIHVMAIVPLWKS